MLYYFPEIRKGKLPGGFEWERVTEEKVERIEKEASEIAAKAEEERKQLRPVPIEVGEIATVERVERYLLELSRRYPDAALRELVMYLQTTVRQIYAILQPEQAEKSTFEPFSRMLSILTDKHVIDVKERNLALHIRSLHYRSLYEGTPVSGDLAERIIVAGVELLALLAIRRERLKTESSRKAESP